MVVIKKLNIII